MLSDTLLRSGKKAGISFFTGSFVKQSSVGSQDVPLVHVGLPGLSSLPDGSWALVLYTAGSTGATSVFSSTIFTSLGFIANGGGSISQYSVAMTANDNVATSDAARRAVAKALTNVNVAGSAAEWEADFVSFPSGSSFRLNWTTNAARNPTINYILFTGLTNAKVVAWQAPTSPTSKYVSGVGFSPDLVFTAHANTSALGSATSGNLGFGVMNKQGQQWSNSVFSFDGNTPTSSSRWQRTDSCAITVNNAEADDLRASFQSMHATDGFNVYFGQQDFAPSQRDFISLCIDGISSKIGSYIHGTSLVETISSRQGFTPKGVIFSNVGLGPITIPAPTSAWALGSSDLTNERVSLLVDVDAVNPTQADSYWNNVDSIAAMWSTAGPTARSAGISSSTDNSLIVDSGASNLSGLESLYCIVGDKDVDTYPLSIKPSELVDPTITAYSNQKKRTKLSTGREVIVRGPFASGPTASFNWSDDGFKTVTDYGADISGWANGSIDSYIDSDGDERIVVVWQQSGTGGGRTSGYQYANVGTFNADRTTLTWGTAIQIMNSSLASSDYPDIVCHAEGVGGVAHIVTGFFDSTPRNYAYYSQLPISASGVMNSFTVNSIELKQGGGHYGVNARMQPSIALDSATKRLHVAWSAGAAVAGKGIRYRSAAYSAGAWTWATERAVTESYYLANNTTHSLVCRWDGTRVQVGGVFGGTGVNIYESLDLFATAGTLVVSTSVGNGDGAASFISDSAGNIHILATTYGAGGNPGLGYYKYTRSGASLSSRILVDANMRGVSGSEPHYVQVFTITGGVGWMYVHSVSSPHVVKYDRVLTA